MPHLPPRRPITQRAIAQLAGVSITTVSRVLAADADQASRWASPAKVEEILRIAAAHGYRRNPHAASLRTARSNTVAMIVPRLQDFVLATIYEGVDEAAAERGFSTFVTNSLDRVDQQRTRTQEMLDRRVDGLIFGDAHLNDPFLDELAEQGVRFVLTSRRKPPHVSVTCDDYLGGRLVAEHLLEIGRVDVAVLAGLEFASTAMDRTQGLLDRFAEAGVDVPPERIVYRGFDAPAGAEAMREILAAGARPDAVFATNDFAAIGCLGALREHGLSVPDDVALVGYNDTPLAASVSIPLTTIRSPMHEMGRRALVALADLIAGGEPASQLLPPELVVRASTI
ncbi:LacI family DNA-binding transcriptional regulator [Microbacterium marinilacus]|uniref:LacI family DNA-binding transcriptional regulator n=1 Tax=Microbacterium marinilacus TaxID=415209 RepID=A0ABP7B572_9MICO|nr:LacI family DNA-binding transcriptional regulator [Microbacterium marinilacus]MBY0689976.1 LacI family transcriptional regulator [Microbacterium marinilacus]